MRYLLLLVGLSVGFVQAQSAVVVEECSEVKTNIVRALYPANELRTGKSAKIKVAIWIDTCGRVIRSEIEEGSSAAFNKAALVAANQSRFNPREQKFEGPLAKLVLPFAFNVSKGGGTVHIEKVVWPASHKKAYFVLDESQMPFESVEIAKNTVYMQEFRFISLRPTQTMMQLKDTKGDIWLFLADNVSRKTKVAARYQRIQAEKPTISVQVLCDPSIIDCAVMKTTLLKSGLLPFAKSLNE